jgi:hypothetical protein
VICQKRAKAGYIDWIAILSLTFFVVGLMYLLLVTAATRVIFIVPAWYLHSLAPVFSGIVGKGLSEVLRRPRISPFVAVVMACASAFLPFVLALQALYFSGCARMMPAKPYYFDFPAISECGFRTVWENLSNLTYPGAALCFLVPGWIAMTVGAFATAQSIRASADHAAPA